jgi:hypothetical protein
MYKTAASFLHTHFDTDSIVHRQHKHNNPPFFLLLINSRPNHKGNVTLNKSDQSNEGVNQQKNNLTLKHTHI